MCVAKHELDTTKGLYTLHWVYVRHWVVRDVQLKHFSLKLWQHESFQAKVLTIRLPCFICFVNHGFLVEFVSHGSDFTDGISEGRRVLAKHFQLNALRAPGHFQQRFEPPIWEKRKKLMGVSCLYNKYGTCNIRNMLVRAGWELSEYNSSVPCPIPKNFYVIWLLTP